jgi:hypothetical protein
MKDDRKRVCQINKSFKHNHGSSRKVIPCKNVNKALTIVVMKIHKIKGRTILLFMTSLRK